MVQDKPGPSPEALQYIAPLITRFGRFYNGFESHGDEHIPLDRPALLVFYHGLIPLDAWYFGLHYYMKTGRLIRALGDRWLFKVPLLKDLCYAVGGVPGNPGSALQFLKDGHLVGVSPGGVREAISGSSNNYKLLWGDRKGFAKVALEAKVDVIPVFTENVDELYRAPYAEHSLFQRLYEKTRLPLVPILGIGPLPFPVKLKTWVGKAIPYDHTDDAESLRDKTRRAIEDLIQKHQGEPSVKSQLRARFKP